MNIIVNGKPYNLELSMTLESFLAQRNIAPRAVVIEYNGDILPREQWTATNLCENDKLEIIQFVGGG